MAPSWPLNHEDEVHDLNVHHHNRALDTLILPTLLTQPTDELRVVRRPNSLKSKMSFKIFNLSKDRKIAFKMKTTAASLIAISPKNGILEPESELVVRAAMKPPPLGLGHMIEKILVQSTFYDKEESDFSTFWTSQRPCDIYEAILRVRFVTLLKTEALDEVAGLKEPQIVKLYYSDIAKETNLEHFEFDTFEIPKDLETMRRVHLNLGEDEFQNCNVLGGQHGNDPLGALQQLEITKVYLFTNEQDAVVKKQKWKDLNKNQLQDEVFEDSPEPKVEEEESKMALDFEQDAISSHDLSFEVKQEALGTTEDSKDTISHEAAKENECKHLRLDPEVDISSEIVGETLQMDPNNTILSMKTQEVATTPVMRPQIVLAGAFVVGFLVGKFLL